ncbi:MAG TPA: hypothetical protein VFL28_17160 [bacterium]|nr:hypothetical protein [bacterium]
MKRGARRPSPPKGREGPGRWIDGRYVRPRRNLLPILIEESVCEEPVTVEPTLGKPASRPAGFWRGSEFHRVVRLFGRRFERDAMHIRVLGGRGHVYELRRTLEMDSWTLRSRWRWDLVATIRLVSVRRLPSDPRQWIWPTGAGAS